MSHTRCAMLVLLGACTSASEPVPDEECELVAMAPCPECGPGEVTGGVGFSLHASYARQTSGETVVLACGRATYLDASYNVLREQELDVPRFSKIVTDVTTDELYIFEANDTSYPEFPSAIAVRAIAADGTTRWRTEVAPYDFTGIMAIPNGVALTDINFKPALVFDRDGNEQPVPAVVGAPDGQGGMIGVTTTWINDGPSTATLTAVDATGQVRWTHTWRAPAPGFPGWLEVKPYPMESGDVVIAGGFSGPSFEVGTTTLTGSETQTAFVARLDTTGATRWAHTLPYEAWNVSAMADGDGVLAIGGVPDRDLYENETELRMIAVAPAGLGTQLPLGTTYELGANVESLRAHGAGQLTAEIEIYSENDEYEQELTIGWHRLLSGLTGRTFLVEMAR